MAGPFDVSEAEGLVRRNRMVSGAAAHRGCEKLLL